LAEVTMLKSAQLVMNPTSAKLTYDDFVRFPDDGLRHELIGGVHYVTPSPVTVHQRLVGRLHVALYRYFEGRGSGEVFVGPFDVVFSNHDVVEPDVMTSSLLPEFSLSIDELFR
jgi:Uma2 family endonuclease